MNRDIVIRWLTEAHNLKPDESIFLMCENRTDSKNMLKQFKQELKILSEIDPLKASKITVSTSIRDQRYWIEIKGTYGSPLVGFKKTAEGTVRIRVEDPDRRRMLLCMKEDGFSLKEIEEEEGPLSGEEKEVLK